jgi:hypothetical protein
MRSVVQQRLAAAALLGLGGLVGRPVAAQSYVRIENVARPTLQVNVETGKAQASAAEAGWWSADWVFEPVAGVTNTYRIKNRYRGTYLNVEKGPVESSAVPAAFLSSQWVLESQADGSYRIRNQWKRTYLQLHQDTLAVGEAGAGWTSASWQLRGFSAGGNAASASMGETPLTPADKAKPAEIEAETNGGPPLTGPDRKIKIKNNAGLNVWGYAKYVQDGGVKTDSTSQLMVLQEGTLTVPGTIASDTKVFLVLEDTDGDTVYSKTLAATFAGPLCLKVEGTYAVWNVSNCDNSIGIVGDEAVRQIRFQNDAGYDAQMTVTYHLGGTEQSVQSGFISGLGGKFRMVNIPATTDPGWAVTIKLEGSATWDDDILQTTLPEDFPASPAPCYKVGGTLFKPWGSTCNE